MSTRVDELWSAIYDIRGDGDRGAMLEAVIQVLAALEDIGAYVTFDPLHDGSAWLVVDGAGSVPKERAQIIGPVLKLLDVHGAGPIAFPTPPDP